MKIPRLFTALCALACAAAVQAPGQDFQARRQIVFGLAPFDGGKYLSTFAPEEQRTIHLTAGFEHALTVNMTDVQYWPASAEYRADFQGLNVALAGEFALYKADKLVGKLERREYIYVFPRGKQGEATRLLYGEDMQAFMRDYARAVEEFRAGRTANPPQAAFQGPFSGFSLRLEPGTWRLVYRVENKGETFSLEKEVVAFPALGRGVRYELIPQEKWTVSSQSDSPNENLYFKNGQVVFIKAFPSLLYNQAFYDLMANPNRPTAGLGLGNSALWVAEEESLEEQAGAGLLIETDGRRSLLAPRLWQVRQLPGSALGYEISDFSPGGSGGARPSFAAYRLSAPPTGYAVRLRIPGDRSGSERSLRTIDPSGLGLAALAVPLPCLLPLAGFMLRYTRRRKGD